MKKVEGGILIYFEDTKIFKDWKKIDIMLLVMYILMNKMYKITKKRIK
jgi:hypothetical protein